MSLPVHWHSNATHIPTQHVKLFIINSSINSLDEDIIWELHPTGLAMKFCHLLLPITYALGGDKSPYVSSFISGIMHHITSGKHFVNKDQVSPPPQLLFLFAHNPLPFSKNATIASGRACQSDLIWLHLSFDHIQILVGTTWSSQNIGCRDSALLSICRPTPMHGPHQAHDQGPMTPHLYCASYNSQHESITSPVLILTHLTNQNKHQDI